MAPPTSGELGAEDSRVSRVLRVVGRFVGRHPTKWTIFSFLVCVILVIAGFSTRERFGGPEPIMSPLSFARQWSVKGGQTQHTLELMDSKKARDRLWTKPYSITMFVAKDGTTDLANPKAFLEMYGLFVQLGSLTAEVNKKTYTFHDVCDRGFLPDLPASLVPPLGTPILPCSVISPMMCFSEAGEINHAQYRTIDAMLRDDLRSKIPRAVSYVTRPSFRNMSGEEIKQTLSTLRNPAQDNFDPGVSRGCLGWNNAFTYYVDLWGGQALWSNKTLTSLGSMRFLIYFDGTARIMYRLQATKPDLAVEDDINEAVAQISHKWNAIVADYGKTTEHLEVVDLEDLGRFTNEKLEKELSSAKSGVIVASFIIMILFCILMLSSCSHPLASRVTLGLMGLIMVVIAEITALGVYFCCGLHLNSSIIVAMPLLALGMGVDDMFIMLRYFSDLGYDFIAARSVEDIIGEVFADSGPGTTLSSLCNVITFAVGAAFPIQAMADFCLAAVFVSLVNYCVMINMFLPLIVAEASRVKARWPDIACFFCHRRAQRQAQAAGRRSITATSSMEYDFGVEKAAIGFIRDRYAPLMMQPAMRVVTFMLTIALIFISLSFIRSKDLGYGPWDLFQKGSMECRSLELIFTAFSFFPSRMIFRNIDVATNQAEMIKLYDAVIQGEYAVAGAVPNFVTALTLLGADNGGALCAPAGALPCDESFRHPQFAPLGLVPADVFDENLNRWRAVPANPAVAWSKIGFMYADMVGASQFDYVMVNVTEKASFSFFDFSYRFPYVPGTNNEILFMDAIQHTKNAIAASPMKDSVVNYGAILVYWEVFLDLEQQLHRLLGIGLGVVFLVTFVLSSFDISVAAITCLSCLLIVIMVYGIAAYFINFNIFVASLVLFGLGMAVEFTAHLAMAYSNHAGNGNLIECLGDAMAHTFPAVFEGSLSTLVSILPLALANNMFTVKYMFGVIALVVGVGMFTGLFLMPGLLSLLHALVRSLNTRCCRRLVIQRDIEDGSANPVEKNVATTTTANCTPPAVAQQSREKCDAGKQVSSEDEDNAPAGVVASAGPPKESTAAASSGSDVPDPKKAEVKNDNAPAGVVASAAPPKKSTAEASSGSAVPEPKKVEDKKAAENNIQAAGQTVGVVRQVGEGLKCSL